MTETTSPHRYGLTLCIVDGSEGSHFCTEETVLAKIGEDIVFNTDILDTFNYNGWREVHHDLLLVSAAVEFADRRCARRIGQWCRNFRITVPVLDPATWTQNEVHASLSAALRHLTGDDWHFSFIKWTGAGSKRARQRSIPFGASKKFAIAYSDGLDSRCVSELYGQNDSAVCIRVAPKRFSRKSGERPFDQIPFKVRVPSSQESSVRSRGFKFAAITAIAAELSGLQRIVVPESGQGALGPVLSPLYETYPDYRNYPTYLRKMELFIKALLGYGVTYDQPRLWYTKGQTIAEFLESTGKPKEQLLATRSCWQQRWNAKMEGELRQCGLCAACLLRRMSLHAASVHEPISTYVFSDLGAQRLEAAVPGNSRLRQSQTMLDHAIAGARHLNYLADMADLPDNALKAYIFELAQATGVTEQDVLKNLRGLLASHAQEWRGFLAAQGDKSFLLGWMERRHGRSE